MSAVSYSRRSGYGAHVLLVVLLAVFALHPLATSPGFLVVLRVFYAILYVGLLCVATENRWVRTIGASLVVLTIALPDLGAGREPLNGVGAILAIVFMAGAIILFTWGLVRQRLVTANTVSGALCIYLLMGLMWTAVYSFQYWLDPASFAGLGAGGGSGLFYFSFVTQTTLGYGDITPASQGARMAAIVQAIIGQVYLVVLVASLVARQLRAEASQR